MAIKKKMKITERGGRKIIDAGWSNVSLFRNLGNDLEIVSYRKCYIRRTDLSPTERKSQEAVVWVTHKWRSYLVNLVFSGCVLWLDIRKRWTGSFYANEQRRNVVLLIALISKEKTKQACHWWWTWTWSSWPWIWNKMDLIHCGLSQVTHSMLTEKEVAWLFPEPDNWTRDEVKSYGSLQWRIT